ELGDKLGVYNHFWETAAYPDVDSTHTVNIVYCARPSGNSEFELDDQHSDCRIIKTIESDLHPYVKNYLHELEWFE
ncbi:MAG: ADP-ribose pyrophosphatase, partial [Halobacteriaceae archaeon]